MKISKNKLEIVLARKCMNARDLRVITSPQTISRARNGKDIGTKTVGKIARYLGVDVSEIIETNKGD